MGGATSLGSRVVGCLLSAGNLLLVGLRCGYYLCDLFEVEVVCWRGGLLFVGGRWRLRLCDSFGVFLDVLDILDASLF